MFERLVEIQQTLVGVAQVALNLGVVRLARQEQLEALGRLVVQVELQIEVAQPLDEFGLARVGPVSGLVLLDRVLRIAEIVERGGQVGMRLGAVRIELGRASEVDLGLPDVPGGEIGRAEIAVGISEIGVEGDRALDHLDRGGVVAALMVDDAEQMERVRMIGLNLEDLAVGVLGRAEVSGLMALDAGLEIADQRSLQRIFPRGSLLLDRAVGFRGHLLCRSRRSLSVPSTGLRHARARVQAVPARSMVGDHG